MMINFINKLFIMKKLLLIPIISLFIISCVSEIGPPGPPGQDGIDGINILGQIFEAQVDFTADNGFEVFIEFPSQIEVFDTDVVIAYILVGIDNGVDIWEPLPQTLFFEDGILLYGYNYTFNDIVFFLDGTVSIADLNPELTQDIIFRVAIIPADAAKSMDTNNLKEVMNALHNKEIITLN